MGVAVMESVRAGAQAAIQQVKIREICDIRGSAVL
jgi:hypothetical protein